MEVRENVIARTDAVAFGRGRVYTVHMQARGRWCVVGQEVPEATSHLMFRLSLSLCCMRVACSARSAPARPPTCSLASSLIPLPPLRPPATARAVPPAPHVPRRAGGDVGRDQRLLHQAVCAQVAGEDGVGRGGRQQRAMRGWQSEAWSCMRAMQPPFGPSCPHAHTRVPLTPPHSHTKSPHTRRPRSRLPSSAPLPWVPRSLPSLPPGWAARRARARRRGWPARRRRRSGGAGPRRMMRMRMQRWGGGWMRRLLLLGWAGRALALALAWCWWAAVDAASRLLTEQPCHLSPSPPSRVPRYRRRTSSTVKASCASRAAAASRRPTARVTRRMRRSSARSRPSRGGGTPSRRTRRVRQWGQWGRPGGGPAVVGCMMGGAPALRACAAL